MRELERKQKIRKRLYSVPVLIVLLAVLVIRGTWQVIEKMQESQGYVKTLRDDVAAKEARQAELETGIAKLETTSGVESEIKGKFSVKKEGEQVAIIVDARESAPTTTPEKPSWFGSFWNTIKSLWQ